ncbi:MAG TPA: hypothetical protein VHW00_10970 [Thermoanaerobaculia bacterium]|nr:hypothetical protein [Thermoanaerobaculia bacterium]
MTRSKVAAVVVVIMCVIGVTAFALTRRPVLFSFTDPGELRRPSFSLLNPLRNREPEKAAEDVLADLRRGDLATALSRVQAPGGVSPVLHAKEQEYPLRKWKLAHRIDDANQVTLLYRASRAESERFDWEVTMRVQKRSGRWTVTDFDAAY